MKRTLLFLCLGALAFSGCLSKHTGLLNNPEQWKVGETTRREVVAKWGNPDRLRGNEWTWISIDTLGSKFKIAYMMIGFTASNSGVVTSETRMTFGPDGRLQSVVSSETVPGGTTWNPSPW